MLFAATAHLLLPLLDRQHHLQTSAQAEAEQQSAQLYLQRSRSSILPDDISPPTPAQANDLMLLFGDGTARASGRWSLVRLSDGPCPLCCHVRGAPAHRCLVPVPPSFAYGVVLPARQAPIGTAGDGSQSQPAPVSGKLLPTYSAAGETLFLRKSIALPASQGGKKNPGCPSISVILPLALPGAEGREAEPRGTWGAHRAEPSGDARFLAPSPWKQPGCSGMDLCGTSAARLMISSKLASCLCSCCLFHREFAFSFQMHRESRRRQRCAHVSFLLVQTPCAARMYKHMCIARSNNLHLPIRQGHAQILLLFQVWVMDQRKPTPQNGQSKLYISLSSSLSSTLKWGHNLTWLLRNYTINLSSC